MPKIMPKKGDTVESSKSLAKEGTVTLQYPLLTKSNYAAWAIKMKVYMRAQGVWDAIEPADPEEPVETRKDQMALAAIYQGIPEETLLLLAEKETANEAWETLKTMHMGAERVKEAKIQTLKSEFEVLRMKEAETIDDFAVRLTTIVNKICALGDKVEETYVVKKFLRAVPSKFLQIVSTIELFGDLKTMTVEEVIGHLKTHEERMRDSGEHVLLTTAEWKAKEAKAEGETLSNAKGRGGSGACGRGRGRSEGDRGNDSNHRQRKFDKAKVRCYNCQNYGHFTSECRSKKEEEKAHLVEKQDDDEPALLMAEACELVQTVEDVSGEVMLNEERVKPRLGTGGQDASGVGYLDTGASNHMTGCRDVFTELDATVKGKVRFGDNSVVDICGRGNAKPWSIRC